GSGAFLFEALIILYPLYNACLSRMRYLVGKATGTEPDVVNWGGRLHFDDLDVDGSTLVDLVQGGGTGSKVLDDLRVEVERINDHPSAEYFIKKSIIVNNLFGVDIMEEAVEICKLRLFLTLIATVERDDSKDNFGVEPLPDIDFNILAGNTLVGYTSIADIDRLWQEVELGSSTLAFEKDHSRLKKLIEEYGKVLKAWRLQQLGEWKGAQISKEQVLKAIESVRPDLDEDIWRLYRTAGLATKQVKSSTGTPKAVELTQAEFKRTHEPFHWMLEFPSIEASGGFEVVVGNPPYVEFSRKAGESKTAICDVYRVVGFKTVRTDNLYCFTCERTLDLIGSDSRSGLIIPISAVSLEECSTLRELYLRKSSLIVFSHFGIRPAKLFDGAEQRLTIVLNRTGDSPQVHSTGYRRWSTETRSNLFETLKLTEITNLVSDSSKPILKLSEKEEVALVSRLLRKNARLGASVGSSPNATAITYHRSPNYWIRAMDFEPYFRSGTKTKSTDHYRELECKSEAEAKTIAAVLNSSLFFWWFNVSGNVRNITQRDISDFPLDVRDLAESAVGESLRKAFDELMLSYRQHSARRVREQQNGRVEYDEFYPGKSKSVMDKIDGLLATYLEMSPAEAQFIVDFDIKYRMGDSSDEDDD
ncbi:MAG: hypothetical protein L6Q31_02890, partial [Fimbriimonadaceae bacterium]|nr:hypothetical protein [Fimbriimonadaceae bacterium]